LTLATVLSAIALGCYIILGVLTIRHNIKAQTNRVFLLYLGAMIFWQLTALMVSVSKDPSDALIYYRLMTAGLGGQFIFFLFFTLIFLGKGSQRIFFNLGWLIFIGLLLSWGSNWIIASVSMSETTKLYVPEFGVLVPLVGIVTFSYLGYGIYSLARGYRLTKSNLHKNRIYYLLLGAVAIGIGSLSNLLPALQHYPIDVAGNVIAALLFTYAVLRYQLLDITVVLRKGLLYSVPTIIIGASYFLLITLAIQIFHAYTETQFFLLSFLVAIVTAIIALPMRDRAQSWIDRIFFREKYDSGLMLQRLSSASASILDMDQLGNHILDEISNTMHIKRLAFFLKSAGTGSFHMVTQRELASVKGMSLRNNLPVVQWLSSNQKALTKYEIDMQPQFKGLWGKELEDLERIGAEIMVPLVAKGDLMGIFTLGPKRSEESYSQDDQQTLMTLANQTAVSVENARLYWELQKTLKELQEAHDDLELRVEQRTAELAHANQMLKEEITQRKRAQERINANLLEKEVLLKEIHHRVKNNLQVVSSLLSLQSKTIDDPQSLRVFRESEDRIRSMALIHTKLYESQDLASIYFPEYIQSLTTYLFDSYEHKANVIELVMETQEIFLDIDIAIPLGLILTELVSNSLKHAFPNGQRGVVQIELFSDQGECNTYLVIKDNGVGFPDSIDFYNSDSLGLRLVNTLIHQIEGEIELDQSIGTSFKISVAESAQSPS